MVSKESVGCVAVKDTAVEKVGKEMDAMDQLVVKTDMNARLYQKVTPMSLMWPSLLSCILVL